MRFGGNHDHNYLLHIRTKNDTRTCGKSVCNQGRYTRHIQDSLVVSSYLGDDEVIVVEVEDFLKWLRGEQE